jgi:hypothetical protein
MDAGAPVRKILGQGESHGAGPCEPPQRAAANCLAGPVPGSPKAATATRAATARLFHSRRRDVRHFDAPRYASSSAISRRWPSWWGEGGRGKGEDRIRMRACLWLAPDVYMPACTLRVHPHHLGGPDRRDMVNVGVSPRWRSGAYMHRQRRQRLASKAHTAAMLHAGAGGGGKGPWVVMACMHVHCGNGSRLRRQRGK